MNEKIARRGRLPEAARQKRMDEVLDIALQELIEQGYEKVTMLGIARRAEASKETLYAWFGNKEGLFRTMIERNADLSVQQVEKAMSGNRPVEQVLLAFCRGLLTLLTSRASVALNRAAMSSPDLADVLLQAGRYRIGPLVEKYLQTLAEDGLFRAHDSKEAFELLYGLTVRDTQIRILLGESPPGSKEIKAQAQLAVTRFLSLLKS